MVAPALVWSGFDAAPALARARVRRRVRPRPAPGGDAFGLLAAALAIEPPPEAPVARLGEGRGGGEAGWFRAEPVMLVPDRDRLVLARLGGDPLTGPEAEALIAAANAHFDAGELRLERPNAGAWYAWAPGIAREPGVAPDAVERRGGDAAPGSGEGGGARARLLNEIQMLWYAHPANAARRAAGRMQANALWLWGGGVLPPAPARAAGGTLIGSDAAVRGLAAWLRCEWAPLGAPGAVGAGAVVVIDRGEEELGARWLDALARRRSGFRVIAASGEWRVPGRLLGRW